MTLRRRILRAYAKGTGRGENPAGALRRFVRWAFDPSMRLHVVRWPISPEKWTGGKLRIVVVSDIHATAPFMTLDHIARYVRRANAIAPDLILLPGDFAYGLLYDTGRPSRAEVAQVLAGLDAPLGVFAAMGNHDWREDGSVSKAGSYPPKMAVALEEAGIPVLENRAVKITRPNGDFWLAGLGDQRAFKRNGELYGTDDLDGTLAQITDDAPAIMMAHEPDAFVDMDAKIALTISGHTHGGQTTFFGKALGMPSKYGTKYAYGHIREDHGDLVVTSGLGCAVVPLRLGVVPEIAVIELS